MLEAILKKENYELVNQEFLGKRNSVFKINNGNNFAILKIYQNKYFPNQREYEANILGNLSGNIVFPKIIKSDKEGGLNYNILTLIEGKTLYVEKQENYTSLVGNYLNYLHKLKPAICSRKLENDENKIMKKAFAKINDKSLENLFEKQDMKGNKSFIHHDPHFRHTIISQEGIVGMIDWEDARYGHLETDYASFIKDQIETDCPISEIYEFSKNYKEKPENLLKHLAKIYLIDLAFKEGILNKSDAKTKEVIKVMLSNDSFEKTIERIYDDY